MASRLRNIFAKHFNQELPGATSALRNKQKKLIGAGIVAGGKTCRTWLSSQGGRTAIHVWAESSLLQPWLLELLQSPESATSLWKKSLHQEKAAQVHLYPDKSHVWRDSFWWRCDLTGFLDSGFALKPGSFICYRPSSWSSDLWSRTSRRFVYSGCLAKCFHSRGKEDCRCV